MAAPYLGGSTPRHDSAALFALDLLTQAWGPFNDRFIQVSTRRAVVSEKLAELEAERAEDWEKVKEKAACRRSSPPGPTVWTTSNMSSRCPCPVRRLRQVDTARSASATIHRYPRPPETHP